MRGAECRIGFSLGRKPKGDAVRNRLPFDSQSALPRLPYDSGRCHSCGKLNYLAGDRSPHNPKVGGSNPPTATNSIFRNILKSSLPKYTRRIHSVSRNSKIQKS